MAITLSVDVGGTKILVAVFSPEGELLRSKKVPTPPVYSDFIVTLKNLINEILEGEKPLACVVGMPGKIDREHGEVIAFGNLKWKHVPIGDDLKDVLDCPIYIENDANLAGLAEATEVLDLYRKTVYVTVSTGIGGVMVVDGKIDKNTEDTEFGQSLLEHNGRLTRWEQFASGSAIVARTGKLASEITDESDWYVVARNIAIGLINVIATLTPECIIIGGGVGAHLEKFQEKLYQELELYANDMITLPQIRKAQHPEEAVVYGGYLLTKSKIKSNSSTTNDAKITVS